MSRPRTFTKRELLRVRVPPGVALRVRAEARAQGVPANAFMVAAISRALDEAERARGARGNTVKLEPVRREVRS